MTDQEPGKKTPMGDAPPEKGREHPIGDKTPEKGRDTPVGDEPPARKQLPVGDDDEEPQDDKRF